MLFSLAAFAIGGAGPMDKAKNLTGAKNERPAFMDDIGIDEHLGEKVDLNLPLLTIKERMSLWENTFARVFLFL